MLAPNGDLARARAWLAAQSSRLAGPPRAAARDRLTAGSGGLPHRPATLRAAQVELWTLLGCRAPLSCLPMGSMGSAPYRLETRPPRFLKVPMVPERPEQDADARRAAGENLQERRALAHLHAHAPGLCPAPVALLPSGTLVAELIDGARPSAGACRT